MLMAGILVGLEARQGAAEDICQRGGMKNEDACQTLLRDKLGNDILYSPICK